MTIPALQFGISIDPAITANPIQRAQLADQHSADLVSIMDHPYNRNLYDTWTLLSMIGQATKNVRLMPNVINLPLRPPAVLAKQAATLDVLTGGRFEMGVGAGSYWQGISAFGGPVRSPGEAYTGFKDALNIMKGLWNSEGRSVTYQGDIYSVKGARPGPIPNQPIPIWAGAYGPRMLDLVGQEADGLIVSFNYNDPDKFNYFNEKLDAGAEKAGRPTTDIRRGYNLMGTIDNSPGEAGEKSLSGHKDYWIERLAMWNQHHRIDTFIFWPSGDDPDGQIKVFLNEVAPAVKAAVA